MADVTSNGTGGGDWGTAGTWAGGSVPTDGQSVLIASGDTVTFNVDQSAWVTGINGLTITGKLSLSRTTGTYYMMLKAAATINGAGTFDCGTLASPIPFAAKHTITGGTGWYIKGNDGVGLTMTVYAAEPAIKTVKLSGNEAIGATVLEVDTDITSDIWADGDDIRVDDVTGYGDTEPLIIATGGRAAGAITVTTGLVAAKVAGAYLHLIRRNVRFLSGGATTMITGSVAGKLTIAGGEFRSTTAAPVSCATANIISGGSFSSTLTGVNTGSGVTFQSSTVSGGIFSGFYNGSNFSNSTISGGTFGGGRYGVGAANNSLTITGGVFYGCQYMVYNVVFCLVSGGEFCYGASGVFYFISGVFVTGGEYHHNTSVFYFVTADVRNANCHDNTNDINSSWITAFSTIFGATVENTGYNSLPREVYSESIDHDQSAGAFAAWTRGGVTSSQAVTIPTGYTTAMQTVLESATSEGYWQKEVLVAAGASVSIVMNLRKSASMVYLPRVIIFNKALTDPFAGGAGIHTFTMTDSVDTWEAETYTYSNDTANDITIVIRTQGKNASGNVFSALTVNVINVDLTSVIAMLTDLHDTDLPAVSTKVDTVDTVVDAIKLKTDNLPVDPADESLLEAAIAAIPTAPTVDNIWDEVVEGTYTARELMRLISAAMAGKASGGGTGTITFRNLNDTANRIIATVDIDGNRSVMVLNP